MNLSVEYQSDKRLNVHIEPTDLTDVFVFPEELVVKPKLEGDANDFNFENSDLVLNMMKKILDLKFWEALLVKYCSPTKVIHWFSPINSFNSILLYQRSLNYWIRRIHSMDLWVNQVLSKHYLLTMLVIQLMVASMVFIQCTTTKDITQTLHAVYWRTSAIQEVCHWWDFSHGVLSFWCHWSLFLLVVQIQRCYPTICFWNWFTCYATILGIEFTINVDGVTTLLNPLKLLLQIQKFDIPLETIWSRYWL